jgi:putative aldouronate transport system permease protein
MPSSTGTATDILSRDNLSHRFSDFLGSFKGYKKHFALFIMFLPVIVHYFIFRYIPMYGVIIAFKKYNIQLGILGSPWCGLDNFRRIFHTFTFIRAFRNTIIISLERIIICFPTGIILALMLNEVRHMKFKKTVQTISYLPHFLSWIVLMGIFNQILSPNTGALNFVLTKYFGLKKTIYFLGDNRWFRPTLIATDIWKNVGWGTILYLAVIAGIDPELYEAAVCDGATRLQRMRHITIPALMPTISILLILNVGGILDAGFDQIFNMYNSAVLETGDIIDTYVYRAGLGSSQYSIATAVGLFKNIIGFILLMGTNKIAGRLGGRGIW